MIAELIYKLQRAWGGALPRRTLSIEPPPGVPRRGRALVSYLPLPLVGDPAGFRGHSNVWESSEIVRILGRSGYLVDLIAWDDPAFVPPAPYDLVFDIHRNLTRFSGPESQTVFHVTGSHPLFSNKAEAERIEAMGLRRGTTAAPRRNVGEDDLQLFSENLERAGLITLIGNRTTEETFPEGIRPKIRRTVATGAWLPPDLERRPIGSRPPEFLWFNGQGAVHKGLDLVLELFARHPELTLHVVGPYLKEKDFVAAYGQELFRTPNIRSHGFLYPSDRRFLAIASRVRAFVSPSCSEGISTAGITCMQAGMVPVISEQCGIDLPEGGGLLLGEPLPDELERSVLEIAGGEGWRGMAEAARSHAWSAYSRDAFSRSMSGAIAELVRR